MSQMKPTGMGSVPHCREILRPKSRLRIRASAPTQKRSGIVNQGPIKIRPDWIRA